MDELGRSYSVGFVFLLFLNLLEEQLAGLHMKRLIKLVFFQTPLVSEPNECRCFNFEDDAVLLTASFVLRQLQPNDIIALSWIREIGRHQGVSIGGN
jgi:hypothetical protein